MKTTDRLTFKNNMSGLTEQMTLHQAEQRNYVNEQTGNSSRWEYDTTLAYYQAIEVATGRVVDTQLLGKAEVEALNLVAAERGGRNRWEVK